MAVFEKKLDKLMIDPSILTSYEHMAPLINIKQKLFISATLVKAIEKQEINKVLKHFVWPYYRVEFPKDLWRHLKERVTVYEYEREYVEDIAEELYSARIPKYVKGILLDEYSFLKQNSALLLRLQKTIQHFKRIGIPVLDFGNKLVDKKRKILEQIRVLNIIIALLLECDFIEQTTQDPLWKAILEGARYFLIVSDP